MDKSASGLVEYIYGRVNILSLVGKALEANRGFADSHRVVLRLADTGSVRDVRADPDRLTQAITNLLSNAIKFSPADEDVVVKIENAVDAVRISVRNYGPGIPAEFKSLVFERFAQADATNTRQKGGTGLGLSIVKQIVERLGGKVGFDDALGGGTIFHIELPAWQELSASAGRAPTAGQASAPMLVVDPMPAANVATRKIRHLLN
jgi:signal transduction histidine kinase